MSSDKVVEMAAALRNGKQVDVSPDQASENLYKIEKMRADVKRRIKDEERAASLTTIPEVKTLAERLAMPKRPTEWRVEELQQIGHRAIFAAQFKAGKTTLVSNLVRSLLDGVPFLDRFGVSQASGTVALLDFEMAEENRGQLDDWYERLHIQASNRLLIVPLRGKASAFNVTLDDVVERWARLFEERAVEYLIVDCLRPAMDGAGLDENHDAGRFLVGLDALLVEAKIRETLVVHHMGHQNPGAPKTERARGDSRILDWPDVLWTLVRETEDPASARFLKAFGRGVEMAETRLDFDAETGRLAAIKGMSRAKQKAEERAQEVLAALLAQHTADPDLWLSTTNVVEEVGGNKAGVISALRALVDSRQAETKRGPHAAKLYRWTEGAGDVPF